MNLQTEFAPPPPKAPSARLRRQRSAISALRERLFELQCELDPDPAAIDAVMRQLATVRSGSAAPARAAAA